MADVQLSPMEVRGRKHDVWLSSKGEFRTRLDQETVYSPTLDGLREKIMRATKRATLRLNIPAMQLRTNTIREANKEYWLEPITLRGLHASNGNVMIADSKGKVEQDSGYSYRENEYFRVMTAAEQKEFMRLHAAKVEAEKAYKAYSEERVIKPRDLVKAELEKVNALD